VLSAGITTGGDAAKGTATNGAAANGAAGANRAAGGSTVGAAVEAAAKGAARTAEHSAANRAAAASSTVGAAARPFVDEPELLQGICHASVVGAGRMLYVLGGETRDGISVSAIRYAYIEDDGSLGFGPDGRWETNPTPLPEARSRAACVFHDGWVYLFGGLVAGRASDSVIRARVYQDGQVGMWYPVATLPEPAILPAAVYYKGFFFVFGGVASLAPSPGLDNDPEPGARVLDSFCSFELGSSGDLGDRRVLPGLLRGRFGSCFVIEGESFLLAGGFASYSQGSDEVFRFSGGEWSLVPGLAIGAEGPSSGRAAGTLFFLPRGFDSRNLGSVALDLGPEAPEALPGSGKVPANSPIVFLPEPGTVVRYAMNGQDVSASSPLYSLDAPPHASGVVSLAAFGFGGITPSITKYEYTPTRLGFFVNISGDLALRPGETSPLSLGLGWYRVRILENGLYRFCFSDPGLTAALVERDLLTDVPGFALVGGRSPELWLQAGTYYLKLTNGV
jgi:hypothetical protein